MLSTEVRKKPSEKPAVPHLCANDPETAKIRRGLIVFLIRSSITFWLLILLVALIYLGSGVDPNWHTQSLDVFVASFDNGLAGTFFIQAFQNSAPDNQTLNWIFQQPSESPSTIIDRINNGEAWAYVYMSSGTSDRFNQVFQFILNGNVSSFPYDPTSAVTIVYDEGRNLNTINGFVLPPIRAAITMASARYSDYFRSQVAQFSNPTLAAVMTTISVANITNSPISYTNMNLHPATPYASILATTLGYLFLWLIMVSLVAIGIRITTPLAGKITLIDIVFIRIINAIFNGLIVSLLYSLCVLWFANFTQAAPFIRFWLFNWLAALTFTAIIALFTINLGPLAQVALTLFLIINLSSATTNVAIELQNRFYRVGYGLPLYHCFNGGRGLLFGSYTRLNVDIAVLFAYYIGAVILALTTGVHRMRKQQREIEEKQRQNPPPQTEKPSQNIRNRKK